jgi:hypothetical protein
MRRPCCRTPDHAEIRGEVPSVLLYYTQSEEVTRAPAMCNELRGLIGIRHYSCGIANGLPAHRNRITM